MIKKWFEDNKNSFSANEEKLSGTINIGVVGRETKLNRCLFQDRVSSFTSVDWGSVDT